MKSREKKLTIIVKNITAKEAEVMFHALAWWRFGEKVFTETKK